MRYVILEWHGKCLGLSLFNDFKYMRVSWRAMLKAGIGWCSSVIISQNGRTRKYYREKSYIIALQGIDLRYKIYDMGYILHTISFIFMILFSRLCSCHALQKFYIRIKYCLWWFISLGWFWEFRWFIFVQSWNIYVSIIRQKYFYRSKSSIICKVLM